MVNGIFHNWLTYGKFTAVNVKRQIHTYDEFTDQPTNRPTDIRVHGEITLSIMVVVVGGMGEERWIRSSGVDGFGGAGGVSWLYRNYSFQFYFKHNLYCAKNKE